MPARQVLMVEPLGFQSVWGVEHHFTDYTMCPDVLQFLSYMAGRTPSVQLGSMVVVLPWHDPMRVAEEVSMLDNLSGGRLILGLGRGAGKVEFDGFRLSMDESRPRFVEAAEMLLRGLESGYCEYDGVFVKQPRAAIRLLGVGVARLSPAAQLDLFADAAGPADALGSTIDRIHEKFGEQSLTRAHNVRTV